MKQLARPVALTTLAAMLVATAVTPALAETPYDKLRRIGNVLTAAYKRLEPLPATAADGARVADQIDRVAASAKAALTPDLRVVSQYRDVVEYAEKLPANAAALRLAYPCRDGILAGINDIKRGEVLEPKRLATIHAACAAFEKGATNTKLGFAVRAQRRAQDTLIGANNRAIESRATNDAKVRAEATRAAEQAATVMGKLPEMTLEDAANPAKIAEAFTKAPELVMHATKGTSASLDRGTCETGDGSAKQLQVYWGHNGEASGLRIEGPHENAFATMPLLVWQRDGQRATVVTADGLRYTTDDVTKLEAGAPASWPKSLTSTCIDEHVIEALREKNAFDAAILAKVEAASTTAYACVKKVWTSGEREFAANDTANITASTRANRYSALLDKYGTAVDRKCAPQLTAYQTAMRALAKSFAKPREATLAAATAALAK